MRRRKKKKKELALKTINESSAKHENALLPYLFPPPFETRFHAP